MKAVCIYRFMDKKTKNKTQITKSPNHTIKQQAAALWIRQSSSGQQGARYAHKKFKKQLEEQ